MRHKRYRIRGTPLDEQPFSKTTLLKLFKDIAGVTPNDIRQEGTDILFYFYSEEEVDKLLFFSAHFSNQHLRLNFPRQYLASHSVIVHDLSQWIVEQDVADESAFMHDFKESNPDLGLHEAHFFNGNRSLKLTFETTASATLATRNGVYSFGIHIPPFRVKMERYYIVNQCLKCYEYTHSTSKCQQPIQKCSLCSANHHYSICKAKTLCCLLCKGDHPAISIRCPHRQEIIKNMEKTTSSAGPSSSAATNQSATASTSGFNAQATIFPELPGGRSTATASQWGPSSQPTNHSSSQPPPPPAHLDQPSNSTVQALTSTASMIAGNNPQEYVRILNILYKVNGLPAFIVPDEVYTNTTATSTSTSSSQVPDITVNAAVLTDILSSAAKPTPPATSSKATQTPTPPLSTTTSVPPPVCEPSQRLKSTASPIKSQQARTHHSRFTASNSESADSSDEDVSVGTPPPPLKHPYTPEDFRLETTSTDRLTMSTRSKDTRPARRPGKKKQ